MTDKPSLRWSKLGTSSLPLSPRSNGAADTALRPDHMVTIRNPDGSFEKARVFVRVSALVVGLDFATKVVAAARLEGPRGLGSCKTSAEPKSRLHCPVCRRRCRHERQVQLIKVQSIRNIARATRT